MTVTYASLLAEARAILLRDTAELSRLSSPESGREEAGAALIALDRLAVISGLIGYRQAGALCRALRHAIREAGRLGSWGSRAHDISLGIRGMEDCARAIKAAPDYGELVLPSGQALRPPLTKPVDTREAVRLLCASKPLPLLPSDAVFIPEDSGGIFRLSIDPRLAATSRAAGRWMGLAYFDAGAGLRNGAIGLEETRAALQSMIARGEAIRYGGLSMSVSGFSGSGALLPCYLVVDSAREPQELLAAGLPLARLLRVISSPSEEFSPDPASGGPEPSSFLISGGREAIGGEDEEGARAPVVRTLREERPAPETPQPTHRAAKAEANAPDGDFALPDMDQDDFPMPQSRPPMPERDFDAELLPPDVSLPPLPEEEAPSFNMEELRAQASSLNLDRAPPASPLNAPASSASPTAGKKDQPASAETAAASEGKKTGGFFMPISVKMIGMISLLMVLSLGTMIILASYFFRIEARDLVDTSTLQVAQVMADKLGGDFGSILDKAGRYAQAFRLSRKQFDDAGQDLIFANDKELLFVGTYPDAAAFEGIKLSNTGALAEFKLDAGATEAAVESSRDAIEGAWKGGSTARNVSATFREPAVLAAWNYNTGAENGALVAIFLTRDRFQPSVESKGKSVLTRFMVSSSGDLLAHSSADLVAAQTSYAKSALVAGIVSSPVNYGQNPFTDEEEGAQLASWARLKSIDAYTVVTMAEKDAFAVADSIQLKNTWLTLIVMAMAFLMVYFYSKSITTPIRALVDAARRIEQGQFYLTIKPRARDELGRLTTSFVQMGQGLAQREKLKETFGKFVNRDIAEKAMSGDLKIGGERKRVTVFFSDIRGFTSISEKLEPEDVVVFLNAYMTRMVSCVNETHGVVDKYIGDAIMAVWGAPESSGNDAENAINAALMMRKSLIEFNKDRGGPRTPIIHIGCGINSGPVIAGQIGSNERMEYTVIGDTVNLASRVEALNKPFGSDILITADTLAMVDGIFNVEAMKAIMVKGKTDPQQIYAVLGRKDDPYCVRSLAEVQSMLGIEHKDLSEVNVDEEEVKYKIVDSGGAPKAGKR